jgi:hypothetical protein
MIKFTYWYKVEGPAKYVVYKAFGSGASIPYATMHNEYMAQTECDRLNGEG